MWQLLSVTLIALFQACSGGSSIDSAACATAWAGESQSQAYLAKQRAALETAAVFTADALQHATALAATQQSMDATQSAAAWQTAVAPSRTPYPTQTLEPTPTPLASATVLPSVTPQPTVTPVPAVSTTATSSTPNVLWLILGLAMLGFAAWRKWDWIARHMKW